MCDYVVLCSGTPLEVTSTGVVLEALKLNKIPKGETYLKMTKYHKARHSSLQVVERKQ